MKKDVAEENKSLRDAYKKNIDKFGPLYENNAKFNSILQHSEETNQHMANRVLALELH